MFNSKALARSTRLKRWSQLNTNTLGDVELSSMDENIMGNTAGMGFKVSTCMKVSSWLHLSFVEVRCKPSLRQHSLRSAARIFRGGSILKWTDNPSSMSSICDSPKTMVLGTLCCSTKTSFKMSETHSPIHQNGIEPFKHFAWGFSFFFPSVKIHAQLACLAFQLKGKKDLSLLRTKTSKA